MEKVIEKLEQNNCIQLNLKLIQIIGIIPSIVFSYLLEKMKFSNKYPFHYSIDKLKKYLTKDIFILILMK